MLWQLKSETVVYILSDVPIISCSTCKAPVSKNFSGSSRLIILLNSEMELDFLEMESLTQTKLGWCHSCNNW